MSIFRPNYTTLDLVINDYNYVLALLHILHQKVFQPSSPSFMGHYKKMKFRMKLMHEAWNRSITLGTLIYHAVLKTLQQKCRTSARLLKQIASD